MNGNLRLIQVKHPLARCPDASLIRWAFIAVVLFAAATLSVASPAPSAAQTAKANSGASSTASQSVAHGKELYIKNACYQCHGYEGQGGSAGPRLAPDPLPWQAIAAYIRKPAGQMPPFTSKLLPDADVQAIYEYLKSRPGPVDIKNIPTFTR